MEPMLAVTTTLARRQIWAHPTPTTTTLPHTCSPYLLPSGGVLNLGNNNFVTLNNQAVFQPHCTNLPISDPPDPLNSHKEIEIIKDKEPFYTSTNPQIYAISAATIVSYMLVIILFITPRTFYVGGVGGGVSLLGRKGTIGGSYGSNTVIGIGSRPWLQKLAALTLAISMTIVTADTFKWAEKQYDAGYEDANQLSEKVIKGLEIRIVRLISETFLWLAQAQTLIRLFQRHKEKLVIQWTAFVLITLEIIFTVLNSFVHEGNEHQTRSFAESIPALNYLFALSLNICYAAFVIVYALRKRRLAFFHPQMHSMPLTALLSLISILIPVNFFIVDLSKPDVSGWGSYVRWVGACAASVVVWEWVERIEALEREEKKDGILGREVFDGDEMLDTNAPKRGWPRSPSDPGGKSGFGGFGSGIDAQWIRLNRVARRIGGSRAPDTVQSKDFGLSNSSSEQRRSQHELGRDNQFPPQQPSSPISRNDTTSAASTVYNVVYHPTEATPPVPEGTPSTYNADGPNHPRQTNPSPANAADGPVLPRPSRLSRIPLPFRRQRQSPPAEVAAALAGQQIKPPTPGPAHPSNLLERLHLKKAHNPIQVPSGIIYVPAPSRRRTSTNREILETAHDFEAAEDDAGDDDESQGGEDRPPATVRNALRMSNPATPVTEFGHFPAIDHALERPGETQEQRQEGSLP